MNIEIVRKNVVAKSADKPNTNNSLFVKENSIDLAANSVVQKI